MTGGGQSVKPGSQCARVLEVLSDCEWHTVAEIHDRAGTMRLNSRISDLRLKYGYAIEHDVEGAGVGAHKHRYRLLAQSTLFDVKEVA